MDRISTLVFTITVLTLLAFPAYAEAQKSPFVAAALETVVPVAGHVYAGDAKAGLAPATVFAAGLGLYVAGTYLWTDDFAETLSCIIPDPSCDDKRSSGGDALLALGVAAMLGGKIWGVWSAVDTARRFDMSFRPSGGVTLAMRFSLQ